MTTLRVEKKENPVRHTGYGTVVKVKASAHADAPFKAHCGCGWWDSIRYEDPDWSLDSLVVHWWERHCPTTWIGCSRFRSE